MSRMEKIVIIGSAGAGKSTFARQLGDVLDIEVFHLDRYFWGGGWKEKSPSERKRIQRDLMREQRRWIIEGTYLGTSDERLGTADTIIFLDTHVLICLWRVIKRRLRDRNKDRLDLPMGCTEKLRPAYILKVLVFPLRGRKLLFQKLQKVGDLNFVHLSSTQEIAKFLRQEVEIQQQSVSEWTHDNEDRELVLNSCLPTKTVSFG